MKPLAITRINVLRALDPAKDYPRFYFGVAVDGALYDLVLSSSIADWLKVCCTGDERVRLDALAAGGTPEKVRAAVIRKTSDAANRDRNLYVQLEVEAMKRVYADQMCETAEYWYLFVSQGIALQLCRDAEADKLPPELAEYVLRHRRVLTKCGGFELLTACFESLDIDADQLAIDSWPDRPCLENNDRQWKALLRALL